MSQGPHFLHQESWPGTGIWRGTYPRLEAKWYITPPWGSLTQCGAPTSPFSHRASNQWDPMAVAWGDRENCILWARTWQKIVSWKLQAACSNMAIYSGTVLAGCSICVSSQHKCPLRLSLGLTDHFLEFHVSYIRRKKLLTSIKSKIIKLSKLEILLFV